jgi:hypoxanthine-guanine phosphoribosyltransferase
MTRAEINADFVLLEKFGTVVLHKERDVKPRIEELADRIALLVGRRSVTFVCLGNGAESLHARLIQQKPINRLKYKTMLLRARGYNGIIPVELQHDAATVRNLDEYGDTNFVLVDEVRHTGQTMFKMKQFFRDRFSKSDLWSLCLIDRPDCHSPEYGEPLDLCGFRVYGRRPRRPQDRNQQGWLVGYGMDVDDWYRGEKSVWWTVVTPNPADPNQDVFRKPRKEELPDVLVESTDLRAWEEQAKQTAKGRR